MQVRRGITRVLSQEKEQIRREGKAFLVVTGLFILIALFATFQNQYKNLAEVVENGESQSVAVSTALAKRLESIESLAKQVLREDLSSKIETELNRANVLFWARGRHALESETDSELQTEIEDFRWLAPEPTPTATEVSEAYAEETEDGVRKKPEWKTQLVALLNSQAETLVANSKFGVSSAWIAFDDNTTGVLWVHRESSDKIPFFFIKLASDQMLQTAEEGALLFLERAKAANPGAQVIAYRIGSNHQAQIPQMNELESDELAAELAESGAKVDIGFKVYRSSGGQGRLGYFRRVKSLSMAQPTYLFQSALIPPELTWILGYRSYAHLPKSVGRSHTRPLKKWAVFASIMRNPGVWPNWMQICVYQYLPLLMLAWGGLFFFMAIRRIRGYKNRNSSIPFDTLFPDHQSSVSFANIPQFNFNRAGSPLLYHLQWIREFQKPAVWLEHRDKSENGNSFLPEFTGPSLEPQPENSEPKEADEKNGPLFDFIPTGTMFVVGGSLGVETQYMNRAKRYPLKIESRVSRYLAEGFSENPTDKELSWITNLHSPRMQTLSKALASSVVLRNWIRVNMKSEYWRAFPVFSQTGSGKKRNVVHSGILIILLDQPPLYFDGEKMKTLLEGSEVDLPRDHPVPQNREI